MNILYTHLSTKPVSYVTRDVERALGFGDDVEGFFIISNKSTFANTRGDKHATMVDTGTVLGTRELLESSTLPEKSNVLIFKNTRGMERIAHEHGWNLLNPPARLSDMIEEKISQVGWLGALNTLLPSHHISSCGDLLWSGDQYIVQFNHAHSGEGTLLISSQKDVDTLREKFPARPVRVTQFVRGAMYTVNAVVHDSGVLVSSPSYQITGIAPFTTNVFTTIGNDWGVADTMLSAEQKEVIRSMAVTIGENMRRDGWKGLFGIDVLVEETTGTLYLIEINARQPASTTYESMLQRMEVDRQPHPNPCLSGRQAPLKKGREYLITTFEAHLATLLDLDLSGYSLIPVTSGAQIIQRITDGITDVGEEVIAEMENLGCTVRKYTNTKIGSELLRIQSEKSMMNKHNLLDDLGQTIAHILQRAT